MRILITGATGFVGRHLYRFLENKYELYILKRVSSDSSKLNPKNEYEFDGDIDSLSNYMKTECIDGIIHLATLYVAEHRSEQIKDLIDSNVFLGTAVLEAACKANIKWFINTGTIWQNYNVPDYSDEYCPVNLYAATKQAFMTIAKYFIETTNIRFATLKLCDTYGPDDSRRKIIDLFKNIASTGETLAMSPGEQKIDIVKIDHVVKEFEKLIRILSDQTKEYCPEYVVTSGTQISLKDLAKEYETLNNVTLNIEWGGRPYRQREVMRPYIGTTIPD